jgi:hypothetical protein
VFEDLVTDAAKARFLIWKSRGSLDPFPHLYAVLGTARLSHVVEQELREFLWTGGCEKLLGSSPLRWGE